MIDRKPPQKPKPSVVLPSSLLQDVRKEPLQVVAKPYLGITHRPSDVTGGVAGVVFDLLLSCFQRQQQVAEGLLPNLIWGFQECGHDPRMVAAGLTELRSKGYLYYTDPIGNRISEHNFDPKTPVWVRYQPKLLNLLVRPSGATELRSTSGLVAP